MSTDYCTIIFINNKFAILNFKCTLGMWIVGSFLSRPRNVTIYVVNIESLSLGFKDPHRNVLIFQVLLVEVEDDILTGHFH